MTMHLTSDSGALARAIEIGRRTLAGDLDPLQACRDMAILRTHIPSVPREAIDAIIAVASEVDDLPLGVEREQWSEEALKAKDAEAAEYRARVGTVVRNAMKEIVDALEHA